MGSGLVCSSPLCAVVPCSCQCHSLGPRTELPLRPGFVHAAGPTPTAPGCFGCILSEVEEDSSDSIHIWEKKV